MARSQICLRFREQCTVPRSAVVSPCEEIPEMGGPSLLMYTALVVPAEAARSYKKKRQKVRP